MAKSNEADASGGKKKGGLLVPLVLLTVLAAGGGGLIGTQILASVKAAATAEGAKPGAAPAPGTATAPETAVKELIPIVTNLAAPDDAAWIRVQTAIVYDKADTPQIEMLSSRIADDMLAFVRTLTLEQLQGASGLQHLREDLNERVSVRSDGHIHELMIETLVIQ